MYPPLAHAQVVSVDAARGRLNVVFSNGQMLGTGVRMMHHGPADALRIKRSPMPNPGTWGLVAFPYGNSMNGLWLGSFYTSQQDALPDDGTDPFMDYESHHSGAWTHMDGAGRYTKSFPDGTYITVSDATTRPAMYRHIVDDKQVRQRTTFTDAQRVPAPPAARNIVVNHASGTVVRVDPAGNTSLTGATAGGKATLTFTYAGTVVAIDASGNTSITGNTSGGNATLTFTFAGTTFVIDATGGITVTLAAGKQMRVSQGGASISDQLTLVSKMLAKFNAHVHSANNTVPTVQLVATDISAASMGVSG